MEMIEAYKRYLRNYVNFTARSTRGDYWWVFLCNLIIGFVFYVLQAAVGGTIFSTLEGIYGLAVLIPGIALAIRRLHDINKSGWYLLFILIPLAGPIILIVWLATDSVNENNNYGARAE